MDPAKLLQVRWYGQAVGALVDAEYATVRIPFSWEEDEHPKPESPTAAHLRGQWVPNDNASSDFLSQLSQGGYVEVYVEPYSPRMTVLLALDADGTGHLVCE
jgi:hypothetical protein